MIVSAIIGLVVTLVGTAFSALPTSSLASVFSGLNTNAYDLGQMLGNYNMLLPASEITSALASILAVLVPGLIAYHLANWTYRHVPQLGGFGPGSG